MLAAASAGTVLGEQAGGVARAKALCSRRAGSGGGATASSLFGTPQRKTSLTNLPGLGQLPLAVRLGLLVVQARKLVVYLWRTCSYKCVMGGGPSSRWCHCSHPGRQACCRTRLYGLIPRPNQGQAGRRHQSPCACVQQAKVPHRLHQLPAVLLQVGQKADALPGQVNTKVRDGHPARPGSCKAVQLTALMRWMSACKQPSSPG